MERGSVSVLQLRHVDDAPTIGADVAADGRSPVVPGQVTGPQLTPALTRPMLGLVKRRRDEFFAPSLILLALAALRVAALVCVVLLVLVPLDLANAYLRPDLAPGPRTDDRVSYRFFLLGVSALQPLGIMLLLAALAGPAESWRRRFHLVVDAALTLLTLLQLVGGLLALLLDCNVSWSGGSLCNDARWCAAFSPAGSGRCAPYAGPAVAPDSLAVAPPFVAFLALSGILTALTGFSVVFNGVLSGAARAFNRRTDGQMAVTL